MRFPADFRHSVLVILLAAGSLLLPGIPRLGAQSGVVDPVFGGASLGLAGSVKALALQPDGKLVVGGGFRGLLRFNTDGSLDPGFDPSVTFLTRVLSVAVQGDGKILVDGVFDPQGYDTYGVARLNADGSLDSTFHFITGEADGGYSLAVAPDGKIIVAGLANADYLFTTTGITRLNADGTTDATFSANIDGSYPFIQSVAVQPDGKILIAGTFTQVDGVACTNLARLNPDGSLDSAFDPLGDGRNVMAVAVQADGKALVGGSFNLNGDATYYGLARLNPDGTVDAGFQSYTGSYVYQIVLLADGRIVVSDGSTLRRLNADGSVDTGFSEAVNTNFSYYYPIISIVPRTDGSLFVGGTFRLIAGVSCNSVAKVNADGSIDTGYMLDVAPGPNAEADSIALQTDGKVLIGGRFTQINGHAHIGIARLESDGSPDASFTAAADGPLVFARQPDGRLVLGGEFAHVNGVARAGLARLNPDGSLDDSFQAAVALETLFNPVILVQPDGKILVTTDHADTAPATLVRLNPDGSVDGGFNARLDGYYRLRLALQPDGKILVGSEDASTGTAPLLVRLNADGSLDGGFNAVISRSADFQVSIDSIVVQPDGKLLVGGVFVEAPGDPDLYLDRLNPDGSRDTTFNRGYYPGLKVGGNTILLESGGKIVVGGAGISVLDADGSDDPFLAGDLVPVEGTVTTLVQQPDGKIIVGGSFNSIANVTRDYIARLNSDGTPDFFNGGVSVGGGFYYLQFPDGTPFGYYNVAGNGYGFPYFFHADLGMEYFFDAHDTAGGAYFFDFASGGFFYASPTFPWPYLYDFTLNTVLYYYPDPGNPGRYNTDGHRFFYRFDTGQVIVK